MIRATNGVKRVCSAGVLTLLRVAVIQQIEALGALKVKSAYLDGELCALDGYGVPVFSRLQAAMDEGSTDQLVFFAFDLL